MYELVEKPKEKKSKAVANSVAQKKSDTKQGYEFVDNRPEVVTQRKRQEMVSDTMQKDQAFQYQTKVDNSTAQHLKTLHKREMTPKFGANPMITQLVIQRDRLQYLKTLAQMMKGLNVHPKRLAYMEEAKQGYFYAQQSLQQIATDSYSCSTYDLQYAKVWNTWRRDLGVFYKDLTPTTLREIIYVRNKEKYGDPLGPTTEFLLKSKSPIDIILSSTRPNEDVGGTLMKLIEKLNLSEGKLVQLIEEINESNNQV